MSPDEIRAVLIDLLGGIAPEADLGTLDPEADLREALDIDSIDFLNFVTALHQRFGIDVPEVDYAKLSSLRSATDYLSGKTA